MGFNSGFKGLISADCTTHQDKVHRRVVSYLRKVLTIK